MASHYEQSSGPDLHAAVQSLPSFQLVDKNGEAHPVGDSRMVVIEHGNGQQAVIIMNAELLSQIKTSLDDGIKAIVQDHAARAKNEVLKKFEEWVQNEQEELSAQMKIVEAVPGPPRLFMSLDFQWSMLNDKLVLVEQRRASLEEEMSNAKKIAELSHLETSARLYELFEAHGFTNNEVADSYDSPPDAGFLRE